MSTLHGGQLVVKSLKKEGVKFIFSLSGHGVDYIYDACLDEGVRVIDARSEQAAARMADGWGRVTGQPGVVAVTDAGAIALVPGLGNAESTPVISIGQASHLTEFDMRAVHEKDQLAFMLPVTKWARRVYETKRIPEYIGMAFRNALSPAVGPVYLDIPRDVIEGKVDSEDAVFPERYRTEGRAQGDPGLIKRAVELFLAAERPIVIAGSGVWWSGAGEELRDLVDTLGVPFIQKDKGRGSVPEDHPLCLGPTRVGLKQADVVLAVGCQMNGWLKFGRPPAFSSSVRVIQVDTDASVIGLNRPVDVGIAGDAQAVLKQMVKEVKEKRRNRAESPWIRECQEMYRLWREKLEAGSDSDLSPIHPARLLKEVASFIDRDAIVITDGGETGIWARDFFRISQPGHMLDHHPSGQLGSAIPYGIAAKLARPEAQVLVYCGDGSFGYNAMEFDTAVRHKVPIVTVIANNGIWASCYHRQQKIFGRGREVATTLGFTRYDKVVEALGGHGEWVEKPEDVRPALERAFASGVPACVNVKVDPGVAARRGE